MKILEKRQHHHEVMYYRTFSYVGIPELQGAGYSFPCHADGTPEGNLSSHAGIAGKNYRMCLTGQETKLVGVHYHDWDGQYPIMCTGRWETLTIVDNGVEKREHHYTSPAIGECACGEEVSLSGFTNTCECGRDYNMSGQLLADRSQWGEETFESLSDILRIP
jgi:hypothetical protein